VVKARRMMLLGVATSLLVLVAFAVRVMAPGP